MAQNPNLAAELEAFTQNQNRIYGNFAAGEAGIPENGLQVDAAGTAPQSGFLVAFRPASPTVAQEMGGFARELAVIVPSVVYGPDPEAGDVEHNGHFTLSDHDLVPGRVLSMDDESTRRVASLLVAAARRGVDQSDGALAAATINLGPVGDSDRSVYHNGKVGVFLGEASLPMFAVRQAVVAAAKRLGLEDFGDRAWGVHSTAVRGLEALDPEQDEERIAEFLAKLATAPHLGNTPVVLDVGFFNMRDGEFEYTPIERYEQDGTRHFLVSQG